MSKILFAIVFLAGLIAISSAISCPHNFCEIIKCQEDITEETCQQQNKIYVPNGSLCGCCAVCVSLPHMKVNPPGDVPVKLCPYPFTGTGAQDYYLC
ncbi:uncharacterized protein [Halyomorpha halys]|uniref:uncharacterized protein n=1 Tax=Halyomorpha halys TaxID=286706 RepID=UPI000D0C76F1|nr:uncharacterized protein LOC112211479 [Halyomorpha halys]